MFAGLGIVACTAGPTSSGLTRPTITPGGVVTTKSVGPIPFGASSAKVRAWAGRPDEVSPPRTSYPIPKHRSGTVVFSYSCKGFGGHRCYTFFGFDHGRLVTFATESPLFRTAEGAHPGMAADTAERRDPELTVIRSAPAWKGKTIPTLAATIEQSGRLFCLYARAPTKTAAFAPVC